MRNRIFIIKCIVIAVASASALALFAFRSAPTSKAESDVILAEIAKYKTWKKVNQKPVDSLSMLSTQNQSSNKEPAFILEGEGG